MGGPQDLVSYREGGGREEEEERKMLHVGLMCV